MFLNPSSLLVPGRAPFFLRHLARLLGTPSPLCLLEGHSPEGNSTFWGQGRARTQPGEKRKAGWEMGSHPCSSQIKSSFHWAAGSCCPFFSGFPALEMFVFAACWSSFNRQTEVSFFFLPSLLSVSW